MAVGLLPKVDDEQQMVLDASLRFIEDRWPLAAVRARADQRSGLDADYRRIAGELGWLGLLATTETGGGSVSGNGLLDAALIGAERGAHLQPGPYAGHHVVVHALSTAPAVHASVLGTLIAGQAWATWAFAEDLAISAAPDAGGWRLTGTVSPVSDADLCDWVLVNASSPDGPLQALVRTDAPGVAVTALDALDVSRSWCAVALDGVLVASGDLVGAPGEATEKAMAVQAQLAAVLVTAESVGAMEADFSMALQYAKDRIAFGRPIGSFQAIKHLLADTSLWLEMAKGLVAAAASSLGASAPDGAALAHAAKSFVGERGIELAHNCFQVFGGIGYTWEHDQHLYLRRLVADATSFGSPAWHRARLLVEEGVGR